MKYSVYGMHRSGTNWLQHLLKNYKRENYIPVGTEPKSDNWKHTYTKQKFNHNQMYLYIYKNPYQWIESVSRNCEDIRVLTNKFKATNEFMIPADRRGIPAGNFDLHSLCSPYNESVGFWLEKSKEYDVRFIYYNDLVKDTNHLASIAGLSNEVDDVTLTSDIKSKYQRKMTDGIRDYYLNETPSWLYDNVVEYISNTIDPYIFDTLKFKKL